MVPRQRPDAGVTLVEVLMACALMATLAGAAGAALPAAADRARVRQAAAFLVALCEQARVEALMRSRAVGLYFGPAGPAAPVGLHVDGNANGLRVTDVLSGADPAVMPARRLSDLFPGVRIAEGDQDGVRLGGTRLLTFSPLGTATPGSIYLTGREGSRYAVRIAGSTARVRTERFNPGSGVWSER
ncbi:MAG: Tfp pilus assembly protein FimT/FimU [Vicinamibacterales bacterium]